MNVGLYSQRFLEFFLELHLSLRKILYQEFSYCLSYFLLVSHCHLYVNDIKFSVRFMNKYK